MNNLIFLVSQIILMCSCSLKEGDLKHFKYKVLSCEEDVGKHLNSGKIKQINDGCENECCDLIQLKDKKSYTDTVRIAFYVHGVDAKIGPIWKQRKNGNIQLAFKVLEESSDDECLRLCIAEYVFYNKKNKKISFCKSLIAR